MAPEQRIQAAIRELAGRFVPIGRADHAGRSMPAHPRSAPAHRSGRRERSSTIRSGLGGAVIGAVIAAVVGGLDRRQRKELRDQAAHLGALLPRAVRSVRRDAAGRSRGLVARGRQLMERGPVSDEVLAARIESALGRGIRHARAIDVSVSDGVVTLSGRVLAADHEAVLGRVRGTRGVSEVRDELEVRRDPVALDIGPLEPAEPPRPDVLQERWSPTTRLLASAAGSAAMGIGLTRRGLLGTAMAGSGALLALRGLTNLTVGRLLGVSGGRRAFDVHKTITVAASPAEVYALWSRFEEFPSFMRHVKEVRRMDGRRSRWRILGPAGLPLEFDAEQTIDEPDRAIGWKSVAGEPVRHAGIVRFEPDGDRTRIDIRMTYNPPGGIAAHGGASLLGLDPETALHEDMLRLKSLLEEGKTTADGHEATRDTLESAQS